MDTVAERANEEPKWHERTRYQVLLFAAGIALFGIVLGLILDWYIDPQTSTQKKDLVQALGLITAGVAGAGGIFFTWRGQRLAREAQEHNQESTRETLRLTEQGQTTERFAHAIDQLGAVNADSSKHLERRLGGIYSLERIARVSEEHHLPIMEVLTAYVTKEALKKPYDKTLTDDPSPDPDIQAILTVIGRRSRDSRHVDPEGVISDVLDDYLTSEGTPREDISDEHHAITREVAKGVNLREVDAKVDIIPLNLSDTDLRGANFYRAYLYAVRLNRADLEKADLEKADLRMALLTEANLEGADLEGADLRHADLPRTILKRANLKNADLRLADLECADLSGTNLQGADLQEAAHLTEDQIEWTMGSNETQLSKYLNRPELWSKSIEEQVKIVQDRLYGAD